MGPHHPRMKFDLTGGPQNFPEKLAFWQHVFLEPFGRKKQPEIFGHASRVDFLESCKPNDSVFGGNLSFKICLKFSSTFHCPTCFYKFTAWEFWGSHSIWGFSDTICRNLYLRVFSQFTSWWTNRLPRNPLSLLEEKFDTSHILFHMFGFCPAASGLAIGVMFHQRGPLRLILKLRPSLEGFLYYTCLDENFPNLCVGGPHATLVECLSAHPV